MLVPIQPYVTNKPFTYMGVKFDKGDLFLPSCFNVGQHKMNALIRARNIGLAHSVAEDTLKSAEERIKAAMASAAPEKVQKPPIQAKKFEKPAPVSKEPEQTAPKTVTPVRSVVAASNVTPASQEERGSAEEGESDKTEGVRRIARRS